MIILPNHKAVYISCERTGSHTMFKVLKERFGGYHYKGHGYHGRVIPKDCRGWFTFATCRNPYARAVSIWWAATKNVRACGQRWVEQAEWNKTFGGFAQWLSKHPPGPTILWPQHRWFSGVLVNQFMHLEYLSDECRMLPLWEGPGPEGHEGKTPHEPWETYYDEDIARNIQMWAGAEFEMFGYSRDINERGKSQFQTFGGGGETG